ncbi:MAG: MFS transporter [Lachnospiraceae bacterium]|nr:MFS transporter [Lachnospiraceae bacterium]
MNEKQEQQAALNPADRPIPLRSQLAYAFNELASNPIYTISLSFLTFFYTDVLGMDAGLVGIIILASKIFDGITDLWAGNLIDHTHTKKGSARPWILRSAILLAASYILLFTVPDAGVVGKAIYIFVTYNFAMSIAFTILNAAINAMPVYMSNDSSSRASAYSIRMIFAGLVQMIVSMVCLNIVDALGGGQRGWVLMAAVFATISLVVLLVVYLGTRETVTELQQSEENVPFRTAIKAVLKNKYWFLVLGMIVIIVFHQVATLTVGVYYAKYILFDEKLAGSLVTYHHIGAAVGMLAMPFVLKGNISKKKAVVVASCVMLLGAILSVIKSEGIFLIISLALRGAGFGVVNSLYYGMLADSVDYGEWKTGVRSAAATTSAGTVGQKLGSGLGTALLGVTLSAAGYNGLAAVQTPAAVSCIRIIFTAFPVILYVLMLVLMHFYDLDEQLPKIKEDLAK